MELGGWSWVSGVRWVELGGWSWGGGGCMLSQSLTLLHKGSIDHMMCTVKVSCEG